MLHAGGKCGIKDPGRAGDSFLIKVVFRRSEKMRNSNLGMGTTNLEEDFRGGRIGERGCDMNDGIDTCDIFNFQR